LDGTEMTSSYKDISEDNDEVYVALNKSISIVSGDTVGILHTKNNIND